MAEQGFRIGVYGVIVRDEHILLVEVEFPNGNRFHLPGGGVEVGESLHQTLHREMVEEICAKVTIGRLLVTWEYHHSEVNPRYGKKNLLELVFECELLPDNEPRHPENPDPRHIGLTWVPLKEFANTPLLPNINDNILKMFNNSSQDVYRLEHR